MAKRKRNRPNTSKKPNIRSSKPKQVNTKTQAEQFKPTTVIRPSKPAVLRNNNPNNNIGGFFAFSKKWVKWIVIIFVIALIVSGVGVSFSSTFNLAN